MELNALSSAFDRVNVLVRETGSKNDVYGEGVSNDKRHMEHRVDETGSNEQHAEKSLGSSVRVAKSWYGFVSHMVSFPPGEQGALSYQVRSRAGIEYGGERS